MSRYSTGLSTSEKSSRIISYDELATRKGIRFSRVWIDELIRQGKFPKKIHLSANRVGWFEHEIDEHLADCAAERDVEEST